MTDLMRLAARFVDLWNEAERARAELQSNIHRLDDLVKDREAVETSLKFYVVEGGPSKAVLVNGVVVLIAHGEDIKAIPAIVE